MHLIRIANIIEDVRILRIFSIVWPLVGLPPNDDPDVTAQELKICSAPRPHAWGTFS